MECLERQEILRMMRVCRDLYDIGIPIFLRCTWVDLYHGIILHRLAFTYFRVLMKDPVRRCAHVEHIKCYVENLVDLRDYKWFTP